jgi:Mor transcription activator family.
MSYRTATNLLPEELLEQVQKYVDGETIYIPRLPEKKQKWGDKTTSKQEIEFRNEQIYRDFCRGICSEQLCQKYFLSLKSIQRILRQGRNVSK